MAVTLSLPLKGRGREKGGHAHGVEVQGELKCKGRGGDLESPLSRRGRGRERETNSLDFTLPQAVSKPIRRFSPCTRKISAGISPPFCRRHRHCRGSSVWR